MKTFLFRDMDRTGQIGVVTSDDGYVVAGMCVSHKGKIATIQWGDVMKDVRVSPSLNEVIFVTREAVYPTAGTLIGKSFDSYEKCKEAFTAHIRPGIPF